MGKGYRFFFWSVSMVSLTLGANLASLSFSVAPVLVLLSKWLHHEIAPVFPVTPLLVNVPNQIFNALPTSLCSMIKLLTVCSSKLYHFAITFCKFQHSAWQTFFQLRRHLLATPLMLPRPHLDAPPLSPRQEFDGQISEGRCFRCSLMRLTTKYIWFCKSQTGRQILELLCHSRIRSLPHRMFHLPASFTYTVRT